MTGGVAPAWTITRQADELELRELSQGDPDLIGSTVRLVLTGSRGVAVTALWAAAIDRQMRHEWNELELLVRSLTKLQPHFLTPWLFQSWNLSYNVSVESDRVKDKYFYISRGIELLAQGERLNRDHPDMRFWIAFYYQNFCTGKIIRKPLPYQLFVLKPHYVLRYTRHEMNRQMM